MSLGVPAVVAWTHFVWLSLATNVIHSALARNGMERHTNEATTEKMKWRRRTRMTTTALTQRVARTQSRTHPASQPCEHMNTHEEKFNRLPTNSHHKQQRCRWRWQPPVIFNLLNTCFFRVAFSFLLRIASTLTLTRCTAYAAQKRFSAFRWFAFRLLLFNFCWRYIDQPKSTGLMDFCRVARLSGHPAHVDEIREIARLHSHVRCQMGNENCIFSSALGLARRHGPKH